MFQHAGRRRKALAIALPLFLAFLFLPLLGSIEAQPPRPLVLSAVVDALIQPVSAEFMVETMDRAARERAELVVFTLRTPGGLLDSTRVIVQHVLSSKVPVAVFVGPAGSRAASAGFLVTISADVAAMAPGTHIGAAHPVEGSGEKLDPTMAKKLASDVAADARTWATRR
jgi:membrane-bound serine protease (ClpP class)